MTEPTTILTGASLHHSFDIHLAKQLGSVELAILVHHFAYWVDYNTRSKKNYHDGKFWTYQTIDEIANHFPYLSRKQVERYMKKLTDQNILVKGNYNKTKFDRTVWYTFSDEWSNRREKPISRNREMEKPESGNQSPDIGTPIPHTKTYTKTNNKKESQPAARLAHHLFSSIQKINPKAKPPNLNYWSDDIEKLMRIDGRSEEEIVTVINWVFKDVFWCKNILSGRKLRDKFDQLVMAMESEKLTPKGNRTDRRTKNIDGTPVSSPADGLF